ncbi:aminotransferase class III-fold pyridoxal phosphate-dependent enzyme [Auritidibacter ignavus]|uniref:aminotransferase class III-fold pyridoxal phosphate-dependent enzyme n=1 Tax=Auritidibacter ignavus TaxID=678932 RepID=UPI00109C8BB3|nr:aminotransferase class III-fold pyridoxal phosphate-dependent enzyme [Auritidibacter ignavus]
MKIGFLAHPTTMSEKNYVRAVDFLNKLVAEGEAGYNRSLWSRHQQVPFAEAATIRSAIGAECSAVLHQFPLTAEEMMVDVTAAKNAVIEAVKELAAQGSELVGLGGTTSIVGGRGIQTSRESPVPVTSGNSLTAFAAYEALLHITRVLRLAPSSTRVAVIGYPGSIALAIARLLLTDGYAVDLVHSGRTSPETLSRHLEGYKGSVEYFDTVEDVYARDLIFVSATSVGGIIQEHRLRPGSIVLDVALPRDVERAIPRRNDILTVDGGFVNADPRVTIGASLSGLTVNRHVNACLTETIILGLEGRAETYSIGRDLPVEKVREIGRIAETHGFTVLPLASWEEPISDADIERLARFHQRTTLRHADRLDKETVLYDYREYCDPLMVDHRRFNFIDTVAASANGTRIHEGENRYLDLDAARGAVTVGHNRQELTETLRTFLTDNKASSTHHVTLPRETSALCRAISDGLIGPGYDTSITTSGEEAYQAATRTVMAATAGKSVLRVHNPALRKLSPLRLLREASIPGFVAPRLDAITAAASPDIGALMIEPFVDSSSEKTAKDSVEFLTEVRALCRDRGIIFIVDESRTAFRTHTGVASVALDLAPDIICFGESLSGGLLPIGASCVRQDLWNTASRLIPGAPVPAAQLAGYNLGSAVALRALELYAQPEFVSNVGATGNVLREGIGALVSDFVFPSEAYGTGLYWQIQFSDPLTGAMSAALDDMTARSPGALRRMIRELPVRAKQTAVGWAQEFEAALEQLQFDRIITKLNQDHRILIDRSRDADNTIVVTPALTMTSDEARFATDCLREVLDDMSTFSPRASR